MFRPPSPTNTELRDLRFWRWVPGVVGAWGLVQGATIVIMWMNGGMGVLNAQRIITPKANMGVGQILLGGAILLIWMGRSREWYRAGAVLGISAALIGGMTLAQHVLGVNLGIDELIAREAAGAAATNSPNRMGIPGSNVLLVLGSAVGVMGIRSKRVASWLALGALSVLLIPGMGMLLGKANLYTSFTTGVAMPTVLMLGAMAVSVIVMTPEHAPMSLFVRKDSGGRMMRALAIPAMGLPLLIGLGREQVERELVITTEWTRGLAIYAVSVCMFGLVWRAAHKVSAEEQRRKSAEGQQALLASIVASSNDAMVSIDNRMRITSWNKAAERIYGYSAEEVTGKPVTMLIPADRTGEEEAFFKRLARGEAIEHYQTVRRTKEGREIDVVLTISPIYDEEGNLAGASKVLHDITELKRKTAALEAMAKELAGHRDRLNEVVEQRTAELKEVHERLRFSERMASLGTLSAGLGHDMGNLLLPIRIRLESLAKANLQRESAEDVEAIQTSAMYLQRLSRGLRLLAMEPDGKRGSAECVELGTWWSETGAIYSNALPRGIKLEAEIDAHAKAAMSSAALTQAVFNLVQNAGDAMRARGTGRVLVKAREEGRQVRVEVIDDGPGMTEEVKRRCIEPFFTTKSRGISTGLGLTLVYGAVQKAGGTVEVESEPGAGARFILNLPRSEETTCEPKALAVVHMNDPRLQAFVISELKSMSCEVTTDLEKATVADAVVVDRVNGLVRRAEARVLVIGEVREEERGHAWRVVEQHSHPQKIRDALRDIRTGPEKGEG